MHFAIIEVPEDLVSSTRLPEKIDIGPGAAERLAAFCAAHLGRLEASVPRSLRLVADRNTWAAMGEEAERELRAAGLATRATVFDSPWLAADERSVVALLADDDPGERLYVAIGSGTITDIVRFVAHRTGRDFVSLATAPSVDAYASVVAAMTFEGRKSSVAASAPIAVFADGEALARSPRASATLSRSSSPSRTGASEPSSGARASTSPSRGARSRQPSPARPRPRRSERRAPPGSKSSWPP
jgi:glycerol dehydrogenase-like iron-containing ADH family enzyme